VTVVTRLRPRFKRRMFRSPELGKSKHFNVQRSDIVRDFRDWTESAWEDDPDAFHLALDLEPDIDEDRTNESHAYMSRMPKGLRDRVTDMQRRISTSQKNFVSALHDTRPPRTEARRYTPRGRRR
jgi:hypothetical protein